MLSKEQKYILFEEGTEPAGTSSLNYEKREGDYCCAGCGTKLFESKSKYESGSGWPSFFEALPNVFETKIDNLVGSPRIEYHCKKCGGHHGHIFDDGPSLLAKGIVIMVYVWFSCLARNKLGNNFNTI